MINARSFGMDTAVQLSPKETYHVERKKTVRDSKHSHKAEIDEYVQTTASLIRIFL